MISIVSAPGKLMVAGEYAVLYGHPCLVAAVDRRVRLTLGSDDSLPEGDGSPRSPALPPEALLARKLAELRLGPVKGAMTLDVSSLRSDGQTQKLGLGSSSAAAAAAAGAVFAAHGAELADDAVRSQVLEIAMAGHREVAPGGSGADVAAATLGGVVRFARSGDDYEARPVTLPPRLEVRVVWTGQEARTSGLVAQVRALEASDPAAHGAAIDHIGAAAQRMIDAAASDDVEGMLEGAEAHGRAMAELGDRAGAPIVEQRLEAVMSLARQAGGAAKPAGAGGGDVAIAFFRDPSTAARFERACTAAGLTLLSTMLGGDGVRRESAARQYRGEQ